VAAFFSQPTLRGVAAASLLGLSLSAFAQQAGQPEGAKQPMTAKQREELGKDQDLLRNFIHFIFIDRADVAAGTGQQILSRGFKPTDFVDLVEGSGELDRFERAISRGLKNADVEPVAGQLLKLYERGKLDRVRNPDEIKRNIQMLTGNMRAQQLAKERLVAAGEYAIPQLLENLLNRANPAMQAEAERLLVDMRQQAIVPLATAMLRLDPTGQEKIADILGQIGYRTATPYLVDVGASSKSPNVVKACQRALTRIGSGDSGLDVADRYERLGEDYYDMKPELTSFPGEEYQLLWAYQPQIGLTMTAVRTEVFHEAMAMRMAERSLTIRPQDNSTALSLWLASNFSREIQTPAEYTNPAYPKDRREAMYYAVAAGSMPCETVLARALDRRDTPLARRAIAAIEQTAGGSGMWSGGGRQPLVEALSYPNRRVQYEAALALGKSQPRASFQGAERVVPILAGAIRDASARFAVVVASNKEIGDNARKWLEKAGYTVLPVATTDLSEVAAPIAEAPGVDLIVTTNLNAEKTSGIIAAARSTPKLKATPVLAMTLSQDAIDLGRAYDRDALVMIRQQLPEEQFTNAVTLLVEKASGGPIKPEEAKDYAARSLAALRDLAVSGNQVFDVGEASLSLIAALNEAGGGVRMDIAEVLSRINQKRVQVALMDAALNAKGDEQINLMSKVADSAKRYGNLLESRQVERLLQITAGSAGKEATAAAALMGSLNLPNNNLVPLILGEGQKS
jgi:HEAT repeat protein